MIMSNIDVQMKSSDDTVYVGRLRMLEGSVYIFETFLLISLNNQ